MENAKKWYLSTTIWGAGLLVIATISQIFGVDITDLNVSLADQIVKAITSVLDVVGTIMVVVGRFKAKTVIK